MCLLHLPHARQTGTLHVTLPRRTKNTVASKFPSSGDRVRRHRAKMRAAGLRPVQIWVPDTRSETFRAEAHRQSLAVAQSPHNELDQAFIDAVSDDPTE